MLLVELMHAQTHLKVRLAVPGEESITGEGLTPAASGVLRSLSRELARQSSMYEQ